MKQAKRIFSVLLMFVMLLSACSFVCAEEPVEIAAASEEDIQIAKKLAVLGVAEERDAASLSNYVLRRDMVAILVKYLKLNSVEVDKPTSPFLDVSALDPEIGAFHALYNAGYISGDDTGHFRPDDYLTYNEAVTMVINAIGYKMFADRSGGYPSGYLYMANKSNMLDGLSGSGANPIPYYDLHRLLNAGLHAAAVTAASFDHQGEGRFVFDENLTFIEDRYGMEIIEGIATGNENTRLNGHESDRIDRFQIEINDVVYDTPEQEYADLLGYPVTAYAKKNTKGEYDILYMEAAYGSYAEMELDADDLLKAKTTSTRIYYTVDNDKEKHINVPASMPAVIYNGKCRTGYGALQNALPDSGTVLALDNNLDSVYDVLFVWENTNFVVDSIETLSCAYKEAYTGASYTLDPDKDDIRVYSAAGREVSLSQIEKGDVISIFASKNTSGYKLITIRLVENVVNGTVEEIINDTYVIDGVEYKAAKNLRDYMTNLQIGKLQLGTSAEFYIDCYGKIAFYQIDTDATAGKYGFVAGVDYDHGMSAYLRFKIYTEDGAWLEADAANPINIDGQRMPLNSDAQIDAARAKITAGEVVIFKENGGTINYIDTKNRKAGVSALEDQGHLTQISTGTDFRTRHGIAFTWNDTAAEQFAIPDGKLVVFYTPTADKLLTDEDSYSVTKTIGNKAAFGGTSASNYGAQGQRITSYTAYSLGESDINVATCLLLCGTSGAGSSSITQNTSFVTVSRTTQAADADGNRRTKLYYYDGGSEFGALVDDKVAYSYLASRNASGSGTQKTFAETEVVPGDVIQIGLSDEGLINAINVVYRKNQSGTVMSAYDPAKPLKDLAWLQNPEYDLSFETNNSGAAVGTLEAIDIDNNVLTFKGPEDKIYYISVNGAKASVFRTSIMQGEDVNFSALQKGDIVLLQSTNGFQALAASVLVIR